VPFERCHRKDRESAKSVGVEFTPRNRGAMNGPDDLMIKESRRVTIERRRLFISDELRRISQQKEYLESRSLPRYDGPTTIMPALSGFAAPLVSRPAGLGGHVKKRPAPSPSAKPQAMIEHPQAHAFAVEKRPRLGDLEKEKRIQSIFSQCITIVKQLSKLKDAGPFLKPVDPVALKCPDYLTIIKHPMDFSTILKRLEHKPEKGITRHYADPAEFVADMRLVFENCRTYNAVGHAVRKMGDTISEVWEKKWRTSGIAEKWEQELKRLDGEVLPTSVNCLVGVLVSHPPTLWILCLHVILATSQLPLDTTWSTRRLLAGAL
jgi:Bromodomain